MRISDWSSDVCSSDLSHPQAAVAVVAPVQRTYTDRVARDHRPPARLVPQREGEDAVEPVEPGAWIGVLRIQRGDHLAVGAALVVVATRQRLLESMMVVDLAIDREHQLAIGGPARLQIGRAHV